MWINSVRGAAENQNWAFIAINPSLFISPHPHFTQQTQLQSHRFWQKNYSKKIIRMKIQVCVKNIVRAQVSWVRRRRKELTKLAILCLQKCVGQRQEWKKIPSNPKQAGSLIEWIISVFYWLVTGPAVQVSHTDACCRALGIVRQYIL